jgi:methionyl aminopeptidase
MSRYEKMNSIGQIVAKSLYEIKDYITPGITTGDIDLRCKSILHKYGAVSSALNYGNPPFPAHVCVSVNNEVCHGVPGSRIICEGDLVSVDIVANKDGYHGDSCYTFIVNSSKKSFIDQQKNFLVKHTYECMWNAISLIKNGIYVGDLGYAMQSYAQKYNLNVIKDFCGHGIGENMHEEPYIPFYGTKGHGPMLKTNQYITIEPMLIMGYNKIKINSDGWTAVSMDGSLSAQFEHTILVKDDGWEVMTFNEFDKEKNKNKSNV